MSEVMDLVNEKDEVICQGTRMDAVEKGLFGRVVTVAVMNEDDKVFLQWRSHKKDIGPRLFDMSCTGHVKAGESYEEAMVREIKEELGIDVSADDLTLIDKHINTEILAHTRCYHLNHNGPFKGWEAEADYADWFSPYEVAFVADRLNFACTLMLQRLPQIFSDMEE